MRPCARATWALVLVLPALARGAAPEATPTQQAAARYARGLEYLKANDTPLALVEFEAAYALVPRFEALFNIGVAHRRLGHYLEAHAAFTRYLAEGGDKVPAERRAQVDEALADLATRIAHVTVLVEGEPAQVEVDGRVLGRSPLPPLRLEAGKHIFSATRPGYIASYHAPELAAGESVTVDLTPRHRDPAGRAERVSLKVVTVPEGAELALDEVPLGRSPWAGEVARGRHVLRAEADGFLPQVTRLDLKGAERTVAMELQPRRWYHHWWVWTAAAVVVAGAATTTAVLVTR